MMKETDGQKRKAEYIKLPITNASTYYGLSKSQMIWIGAGLAVGSLAFFLLYGKVNINLLMFIICAIIAIVSTLGVVRIQGTPLLLYYLQSFKGDDKRYFCRSGVYNDTLQENKTKKKKKSKQDDLDNFFIVEEDTAKGNANMKKKTKNNYSKKVNVPKTAQDTIPFIEAYDNGLFLVKENTYALIFEFSNIDYSLLRDDEKDNKITSYQKLLNGLPTGVKYQELIMNVGKNRDSLENALYPAQIETDLQKDYVNVIDNYIDKSDGRSAQKRLFVALSYKLLNSADTPNILFKAYRELETRFKNIGSDTNILKPNEVFELLYTFYHPFDTTSFMLPQNIYSSGGRIKDYIAPSIINFKGNGKEFQIGNAFCRILYVQNYERQITDDFIADLLDNDYRICVSKFATRIDKGDAIKKINVSYSANEEKIQKRNKDNKKSGEDFIPFSLQKKRDEFQKALHALEKANTELFEVGIFISISAETEKELNDIYLTIKERAWQHQIRVETLVKQQERGMKSLLPFGVNYFSVADGNNVNHYLMTDCASVLMPFSSRTLFAESGLCYGTNIITGESIVIDRTDEMNSNGFVLGTSGGGKSMFSKIEDISVMLKYPNDEIIIIDPDGEYGRIADMPDFDGEKITIAPNSPTRINVFDIDLNYSENGLDAISLKSSFVMGIVETIKGDVLTSSERSIVDRVVRKIYLPYAKSKDMKDIPTFTTFYEELKSLPEEEAKSLAIALELYVTGSFNSFATKSNVTFTKKLTVIDTSQMGEQMSSIGLQIILEMLWQRVKDNSARGVRTWVKVDEFATLFTDSEGRETTKSGAFFKSVYQRIRKLGGVATAITQNITEVLRSPQAETMFNNAEFVVLLQQKKRDLDKLCEIFSLSEAQAHYLATGRAGTGLLICGKKTVPFDNKIPRDSLLYKVCTTNFNDKAV